MDNATMGQRIAEQRKKLCISQEALGEKAGVSRQAISKWESDAAIPEIDKLIALSRLFGVSVDWLLGVEKEEPASGEAVQTAPEAPQAPRPAISIPGWLRRYAPVALLGATLFYLIWLLVYTANISSSDQSQLDYMNARISQLESRIMALETTEKAPGQLLAAYSFDVDATEDRQQATAVFTATPHSWQAGDQGYLSINGSGIASVEFPCQWDGSRLTAAAVLEFLDGYELCFTVEHSDGSRQLELLSDGVLENLGSAFVPTLFGSVESAVYLPGENALELKDLYISYSRADYGEDMPVTWQRISVILYADEEEVSRHDHFNAVRQQDSTATSRGGAWRTLSTTLALENWTPEPGQKILLQLYAEMSNGITAAETIREWVVDESGAFAPV